MSLKILHSIVLPRGTSDSKPGRGDNMSQAVIIRCGISAAVVDSPRYYIVRGAKSKVKRKVK